MADATGALGKKEPQPLLQYLTFGIDMPNQLHILVADVLGEAVESFQRATRQAREENAL
jgi:hypothetical protein